MSFADFKNQKGFSLAELMIAAGVLSLVTLGTGAIIQKNVVASKQADASKNLVSEISSMQTALKNMKKNLACADVVTAPSGFNGNAAAETPAVLKLYGGMAWQDGAKPFGNAYRIDKLYFGNATLLSSTATDKTYTANIYLEGSLRGADNSIWTPVRRKTLTSLSVKTNPAGQFVDCNFDNFVADSETVCKSIKGMTWSPTKSTCVSNIDLTQCDGGFQRNAAGDCVPVGSGCYSGRLPADFNSGVVDACNQLPATYAVINAPGYTPLPEPTDPNQGGSGNGGGGGPTQPPVIESCTCGSRTITSSGSQYCVACRQDRGARLFGLESDYYYSVETCDTGGELKKIPGPNSYHGETGLFKDQKDPNYCSYKRSPGTYNASTNKVVQSP